LKLRTGVVAVVLSMCFTCVRTAAAQERKVDDDSVLAARQWRLSAGAGVARLTYPSVGARAAALVGAGLSLEEAVGLGHDLELGVRFGARLDGNGRGLRADESARVLDTETFGTGLSLAANPELRVRFRAIRAGACEAGVEERVVMPIEPDPNLALASGIWGALHIAHVVRLDAGANAVFGWETLAGGHVATWALGVPVAAWINPTPRLFFGTQWAAHVFAATRYANGYAQLQARVITGYRIGACDVAGMLALLDLINAGTNRVGFGLEVACRP
jgi:hypothetical protein